MEVRVPIIKSKTKTRRDERDQCDSKDSLESRLTCRPLGPDSAKDRLAIMLKNNLVQGCFGVEGLARVVVAHDGVLKTVMPRVSDYGFSENEKTVTNEGDGMIGFLTMHSSATRRAKVACLGQENSLQQMKGGLLTVLLRSTMSLACLVCHSVESPSHSFRSYSVSSSDNDGRCSSITNCLTRKASLPQLRPNTNIASSKVTPQPAMPSNGVTGPPRLVRSRAVRRDIVRDWNFDEVLIER